MSRITLVIFLVAVGSQTLGAQAPGMGLDVFPPALAASTAQARPATLKPSAEAPLPPAVDLSSFLPPVGNQGEINDCAAWSTDYYGRSILDQKERQLAPLYTYNQITSGKNEGTAITDHMAILRDQGIVPLVDFPYTDNLTILPDQPLKEKAGALKINSFKSLPRLNGSVDLTAVKTFLARGVPVIGGFALFDDFPAYKGGIYSTTAGTEIGGHAMAVVGYDDTKKALRIVNSWGPEWGEKGFLWLSYDSVRAMTKKNYGFAVMFSAPTALDELVAPEDLTASKGAAEDSINLTWTAAKGADGYEVYRADNLTKDWKTLGTTAQSRYSDQNLPPGVTYVYSIQPYKGSGSDQKLGPRSAVAEGWTQKKAVPPGIVEGLDYILYKDSVVLVWDPLADTTSYQVFRYDDGTQNFRLIGSTTSTAYRDDEPFGNSGSSAIYMVQAANDRGPGLPSSNREIHRTGAPDKVQKVLKDDILKKISKAVPVVPARQVPYKGTYYQADWFDPKYVDQAFQDYAAKEKAAFENWKKNDQDAYEEFLKNDQ